MSKFPLVIQNLTDSFSRLPGVGPKTALRFVFYLLRQKQEDNIKFAKAIEMLGSSIATCQVCQNFSEKNPCAICSDRNRDQSVICVVAEHQDLPVIENTGEYRGAYHILGGVLDPLHGITPDQLKIKELIYRVQNNNIKEIVLALNPDLEGETTILYLTKLIKSFDKNSIIKITRLARGLPIGCDLEYADEVTVSDALKGRKEL